MMSRHRYGVADDWGVLSVADIIDGVLDIDELGNARRPTDGPTHSLGVACVPPYLVNADLAPDLERGILHEFQGRLAARSTHTEHIFGARFRRLKLSLSSSTQIRQRLSETITSMGASLPIHNEHASLFTTIALLGALTMSEDKSAYTSVLLDSLAQVDWDKATPQSCVQLFRMVEAHTATAAFDEPHTAAVARTTLDLTLRSGRLSLLLKSILAPGSEVEMHPALLPPRAPSRHVTVSSATIADFLVKTLVLPPELSASRSLQCVISDSTVRLLGDTQVAQYEALGSMKTRFLHQSTQTLPGNRGDVVLYVGDDKGVLCVTASGRDENNWHFAACRINGNSGGGSERVECKGRLAVCTAGLSLSNVRFHFRLVESETLCCMVSSHPPQRTRSCLYVGEVSLRSLLSPAPRSGEATMQLLPLVRNPAFASDTAQHHAFHFDKNASVSVGRVTLKDAFHPFCIELWVYPRSIAKDQTFLSIGDKAVDEVLLGLEPVGDGVRWRGGARTPRLGFSFASFTSTGKLPVLERWWHVALNFDGAAWELWLDHKLVDRRPALVSPTAIADAKCVLGQSFIGMVAEVRIWQQIRTAAELFRDAHRPLTGSEESLCGYFPFNESYGNVIMDYAPHREHALLPHEEPSWSAVDTFPVLMRPSEARQVPDFVPVAWIEEADEVFFAASSKTYTVAGVRSDHTLCVFDYAPDSRCLVSQRSVELPAAWTVRSVTGHAAHDSLVCCAVAARTESSAADTEGAAPAFLWEMWGYVGQGEAAPQIPYASPWLCGKAVLKRSACHAQRLLAAVHYVTDQSAWAAAVPPFVLDVDDDVLTLLLCVAQRAAKPAAQRDVVLARQAAALLELNLTTRFYKDQQEFARRVGGCYDSVEHLLQQIAAAHEGGPNGRDTAANTRPLTLREAITALAFEPALAQDSSSALLRCCCLCFLDESRRVTFLEKQAGKQRASSTETVYACLLTFYSSLHTCYDMLASQATEQLAVLFTALFAETTAQVEHSFRERSVSGLRRTTQCLELVAEVLLSSGGVKLEGGAGGGGGVAENLVAAARLETLQCAFSTALLKCCGKLVDAGAAALRQIPGVEATFLRCLQVSPVGALLASFSVSLPLLPTSALEACSSLLQRCRESLLILVDQFPSEEAKQWTSRLCVAITYSLAQLGCALLDPRPTVHDGVCEGNVSSLFPAFGPAQKPAYLSLLHSGQRKAGSERDALIKSLQSGVGAASKVFEELQRKDVSALRVMRDDELREMERQVMAACCALLLPAKALQEPSKEALQPAFQLVLKLRPWVLSKRQESKACVAMVRERAVFLAMFEPVAEMDVDEATSAWRGGNAGGPLGAVASAAASTKKRTAAPVMDVRAARHAERKRWQRLFKSWKAIHQLKALMASREEVADVNVGAEVLACFQSDVSTAEMKAAVAWRCKKAGFRLIGLQLLWQLTEEAQRSQLLARVLHPLIARTLCGWHYADGVDGCAVEQLSRLQSAFLHLMRAALAAYASVKETAPWGMLLAALLSCPFRRSDLRKLRTTSVSADLLRRLWSAGTEPGVLFHRVNGPVPWELRETKLSPTGCASTMTVGASGLTLRSTISRGSCAAPCVWTPPSSPKKRIVYYYEVEVVDSHQGGSASVGVGPVDFALSLMPGWDASSYAYDGGEGVIYTDRNQRVLTSSCGVGDVVGCGWNTYSGEIFWTRNGKVVHTVKPTTPLERLCPLIGMKGRAAVSVNFGATPFTYRNWGSFTASASPSSLLTSTLPPATSRATRDALLVLQDGWDSFRLFSTRAATLFREACRTSTAPPPRASSGLSHESVQELAHPVGCCLDALADALAPASVASVAQPPLPPPYVTMLLGHVTLLCKLLRNVPDHAVAAHTRRLAVLLEAMTLRLLLPTSRTVLLDDDESEAVVALLTAWYHVMYLSPPTSSEAGTAAGEKVGQSSSHNTRADDAQAPHSQFLQILLQLASCVFTTRETRMSASETQHAPEVAALSLPGGVITSCDTAHWLAVSLLQRLNNDRDEHGCHAWHAALQGWVRRALERCRPAAEVDAVGKTTLWRDALLGLAVLGGAPRLPVPGDTVMAQLDSHTLSPVVLLRAAWLNEVCEVLEPPVREEADAHKTKAVPPRARRTRKLPLRFVHATIRGDEAWVNAFPDKHNNADHELMQSVARLAQAWFPLVTLGTRISEDVCCLVAQVSCLLARCAECGVMDVAPGLVESLSILTGLADDAAVTTEQVHLDLVLSLRGLLQYRQRRRFPRHLPTALRDIRGMWAGNHDGSERPISSSSAGRGLVPVSSATSPVFSSSLRLRTFAVMGQLSQPDVLDGPAEPSIGYDEDVDERSHGDEDDETDFDEEDASAMGEDNGDNGYDGNGTDDGDGEDEGASEMDAINPYQQRNAMEDDSDADGGGREGRRRQRAMIANPIGATATTTIAARSPSLLSASSLTEEQLAMTAQETHDTIQFFGGCVRVLGSGGDATVGLSFTVDLWLRLTNTQRHQILFAQVLRGAPATPATELVARILRGRLEFGWLPCCPGGEAACDPADPAHVCAFALSDADVYAWTRVTFVQSGTTLSLFRNGALMETRTMASGGGGALLQEELRLGGIPRRLEATAFIGAVRHFRVYELALRPPMVEQLHRLNSSLSTFLKSHVALVLRATRTGVENTCRSPAAVMVVVSTEGSVGFMDDVNAAATAATRHHNHHMRETCTPELDFGCESEELDLRSISEPFPAQQAAWMRKRRNQSREQLLATCTNSYRQLAAHHAAYLLAHTLCRVTTAQEGCSPSSDAIASEQAQAMFFAFKDGGCVARFTQWAASPSRADVSELLDKVWVGLRHARERTDTEKTRRLAEMGSAVLAELLRVAQQPQRGRTYESSHPQRAYASEGYEVSVPGQRSYSVFLDERSVAQLRYVAVSSDRGIGTMLTEFPSTALVSFEVRLPHFFLTVRAATDASNWGHRFTVVYDNQAPLRAMRLFRNALSNLLSVHGRMSAATAFICSPECLLALCVVVQRSTSKTRLLALTCLNDILLFRHHGADVTPPPPPPPRSLAIPSLLNDIRRMAVRHYRRRLPTQGVLARFIQLSVESYVMQRDAMQCWLPGEIAMEDHHAESTLAAVEGAKESTFPGDMPEGSGTPAVAAESTRAAAAAARFARQRQEQMQVYRQRDSGADRVSIQKLRNPQSLSHEWNSDGLCFLRSEREGGSVVAGVPLTTGKWYYEVRLGSTGSICVGVLPVPTSLMDDSGTLTLSVASAAAQVHEPVAFNGCTGVFHDAEHQQRPFDLSTTPLWFSKDYLGVMVDVPAQRCTIFVNGAEAVHFSFGVEAASEGTAAADAVVMRDTTQNTLNANTNRNTEGRRTGAAVGIGGEDANRRESTTSSVIAYYPYISLEQSESVAINFGAAFFEYDVPAGCLPLDPANLSLGTVFPYNQVRAFQDIAAHLLTGGSYPLPPFYYEEADPFAGSTERVGPAHVSVQSAASVQVNMEDVRNEGLGFETVRGDCAVRAGAWYYEVTLRSQGLMQIGWMEKGETLPGHGHGVGDSSTSWSVDLFRRVKWHRGVPELVNIPRRWSAGDVVGCALDLTHHELSFFLNGRPITGVLASAAASPLTETCTFQGIPAGLHYVPAVSLRSGGAVSFNFGSSPFKHKPEGFNPLGVPDLWNERMDTFYNNAASDNTMQRLTAMQEAWRVLRQAHRPAGAAGVAQRSSSTTPLSRAEGFSPTSAAGAAVPGCLYPMKEFQKHLRPYCMIVQATDAFSEDVTKAFTKGAEDELQQYLSSYAYPSNSGTAASQLVAARSWDMFNVLKAISKIVHALLPFLSVNTTHPTLMTLLFLSVRSLLFRAVRRKLVESVLTVSAARSEQYRVSINRAKAHTDTGSVASSVFGQTFTLLGAQLPRMFQTHQRFWNTAFLGEGAEDAGGPFREHLSEMCRELMSSRLPFFVPTANHVHNTGTHREVYVPAASACTPFDLEAFIFVGKLMGGAMRSEDPLDLFLPPLVWRYLGAYPITETEVEQVDLICVQCVREFRHLAATDGHAAASGAAGGEPENDPSELFDDVFGEEYFVTQLSDYSTKELVEGGGKTRVTLANSRTYADALLESRIHEFDLQLGKMREGMLAVVPEVALLLLTPEELEHRVCGQADYKPEELRKSASYEGLTSEDRRVQLLWKALEAATPLQRRLFLRFVSGRDRLPVKLRVLPLTSSADPDTILPRAATCFFAIELPDYSTLDVMKRKLFYSIENCSDMDTDFNARVIDEDEAPQLSVTLDDGGRDANLRATMEEE